MSQLAHDLRASIRSIRRQPVIPIVAVTILALGLAASVAVFTYINGFHQTFPGVDARGLVRVFGVDPSTLEVGNIVLCKVNGRQYLHLIKAIASDGRFLIGNARGHINGWTGPSQVYGVVTEIHQED